MAQETYARLDEYRTLTGDTSSSDNQVEAYLANQSAKLRALLGITSEYELKGDALVLARELVCDASRKALVPPTMEGFGADLSGATTASFSANGFQQSVTLQNPSGAAYFDRSTLAALKKLLGRSQRIGTISFDIGRSS